MSKKRPYVIVGAFVIGMLLTPPDVISQTLLAIPIWFLFEVGIIFARILTNHRNDSGVVLYDDIDKKKSKNKGGRRKTEEKGRGNFLFTWGKISF